MRYLLDTHVFLWWLSSDKRLKVSWIQAISDSRNEVFVSVVSAWEMSIKIQLGKLRLKTPLVECFKDLRFGVLDISLDHILSLNQLPLKHKDPFDRMIIAQARAEQCVLVTDDEKMSEYDVPLLNTE